MPQMYWKCRFRVAHLRSKNGDPRSGSVGNLPKSKVRSKTTRIRFGRRRPRSRRNSAVLITKRCRSFQARENRPIWQSILGSRSESCQWCRLPARCVTRESRSRRTLGSALQVAVWFSTKTARRSTTSHARARQLSWWNAPSATSCRQLSHHEFQVDSTWLFTRSTVDCTKRASTE